MAATAIHGQKNSSLKPSHESMMNEDESWKVSTWTHRAWLAGGCATLLITLIKCISLACISGEWLKPTLAALIGYVVADIATGIYHWAIDNYGNPQTPIFGSQIESFLGHHQQPWAITMRHLANNLFIPTASVSAAVFPINLLCGDPVFLGFVFTFGGCVMFSQLFHAWAHTPKGKLPPLVVAFQDAGIIVGRASHAAHHRPPYNRNYCIVSGIWNRLLDRSKFFLLLEVAVFGMFGVQPRSWNDK